MAKKKRIGPPETPLRRWLRRQRKWGRRLAIMAGLAAAAIAVWFLADPLGGAPTAIDESGQEVRAGVVAGVPDAEARPGSPAPNFLLPDYEQRAVRLSDFQDKLVFVNFWASWCGPCAREMPDIVRIAERYPDVVVVIAVNRGESKGTATGWTRARNFPEDLPNFHWVLDPREEVVREYQVDGMPSSFFLDDRGIIRAAARQALEFDAMVANVEQAGLFSVDGVPAE